jgi:predicted Zn-dependent peptidase
MNMTAHHFESELLGERYTRILHKSGVEIYVFPKEMSSTYALFATNYGSVDTVAGNTPLPDGIAHFLEHKLFTNEDGSDSFEKFSDLGADANAYTSHTSTVYLFSCTDHFEEAFDELVTFVTHPFFTDESVEKEQGIIGEEIRMCLDNPYDRCYYQMLSGLYRDHAVRRDICGSVQSIRQITPALLYRAHKTFYAPANMVLVVVGNVTPAQVLAIADRRLKAGDRAPLRSVDSNEPPQWYRHALPQEGRLPSRFFQLA